MSKRKKHVESILLETGDPMELFKRAFAQADAGLFRKLLERHPEMKAKINEPVAAFDAPAITRVRSREMLDVLLEAGADINAKSRWWAGGFGLLHSAEPDLAAYAVQRGAVVDGHAAARLGMSDNLRELVTSDPTLVHARGGDGQTPLHFARSRAVIDLLLAAGADIDARDVDHRATAAEWMLDHKRGAGRFDAARYLVERGASADIFLVAALGLSDRARTMLQANPRLLDLRTGQGRYGEQPPSSYHIYFWTIGDGLLPLDVAAQFEQQDTLDTMAEFASPLQHLHLACRRGDETGARAVLREHSGIIESMTPADHRAISNAAWNGDARAVALMSELGFDPRTPGHDGGTALHCAAWEGSVDTVGVLLSRRDARDLVAIRDARYGATPLGWCCHGSRFGNTSHDHAGVARLLLEAGALPGSDTREASASVDAVLTGWRRAP